MSILQWIHPRTWSVWSCDSFVARGSSSLSHPTIFGASLGFLSQKPAWTADNSEKDTPPPRIRKPSQITDYRSQIIERYLPTFSQHCTTTLVRHIKAVVQLPRSSSFSLWIPIGHVPPYHRYTLFSATHSRYILVHKAIEIDRKSPVHKET